MEERATSRSTSVASAIINSSVWFWLSIALIFFCAWLNNHVSARSRRLPAVEANSREHLSSRATCTPWPVSSRPRD